MEPRGFLVLKLHMNQCETIFFAQFCHLNYLGWFLVGIFLEDLENTKMNFK